MQNQNGKLKSSILRYSLKGVYAPLHSLKISKHRSANKYINTLWTENCLINLKIKQKTSGVCIFYQNYMFFKFKRPFLLAKCRRMALMGFECCSLVTDIKKTFYANKHL